MVCGGDRAGGVCVGIAVLTEDEVVGGAADGDGVGAAVIADLRADVLEGEGVGGVDVLVAKQTELGGVSSAVKNGGLLIAEIAGYALPVSHSRLRTHHHFFSLSRLDLQEQKLLLLMKLNLTTANNLGAKKVSLLFSVSVAFP